MSEHSHSRGQRPHQTAAAHSRRFGAFRPSWAAVAGELGHLAKRAWDVHRGRLPLPWVMSFLVTSRCVLRCQHCFYHYGSVPADDELSVDDYEKIGAQLGHVGVALYCGGEPYLRADLAQIVEVIRRRTGAFVSSATTNGQLTGSVVEQTESIVRAAPTSPFLLGVSIDGPEEVHDAIRGAGSFERALRTWRECVALRRRYPNLALSVTTVVSTLNQREAPGFVRWAARHLDPTTHVVLLARQHPRAGDHLTQVDPAHYRATRCEALRQMRAGGWLRRARLDAVYLDAVSRHVAQTQASGTRSFHCWAGVHGALVDPAGRVHVCEALAEQGAVPWLGSLREVQMNLAELWRGPAGDRARRAVNRHPICASCTHETMGHAASLLFPPNVPGRLLLPSHRQSLRGLR